MQIEQIYTGCLAQGAYYIESDGEAVVIDPLRDIDNYLGKAKRTNSSIKYVFETHFHADFVSGHMDLAKATGASIVYGPTAQPAFDAIVAKDGEKFKVGKLVFELLHTPGHTMESCCYLMYNETGKPVALFSGDTIFIGDVGRPDLAQKAANLSLEELAGLLFDSIHTKILPLSDDIIVYPAHGAGSACGKKLSTETTDTLGHQKASNYAMKASLSREDFIKEVTHGLVAPPGYFPFNVQMNKFGYESIDIVIERGSKALSANAFEAAADETEAVIIDTRKAEVFGNGFIPNSINIGIDGSFAVWVGALIKNVSQPILLITEEGREIEVVTRLARVGFDHAMGYLKGGFEAWKQARKPFDTIESIDATELATIYADQDPQLILDVRKKSEFDTEHIMGVTNSPLDFIDMTDQIFDPTKTYYVHCAGGYRSMIYTSIMRSRGYQNILNCSVGYNQLKATGKFKISEFAQQNTQL
ncbi:MAG: MBL fold metallo-hydrolase [Bacteroidetes bacterium]|nr:MBL fold metallo-hydrolase [Bacteroidota bacterium]